MTRSPPGPGPITAAGIRPCVRTVVLMSLRQRHQAVIERLTDMLDTSEGPWHPPLVTIGDSGDGPKSDYARRCRLRDAGPLIFIAVPRRDGTKVRRKLIYVPTKVRPIEAANRIVDGYVKCPKVQYGEARASYRVQDDMVLMPDVWRFASSEIYYAALFHEFAHSTGHPSRLKRSFGNSYYCAAYQREEIVAELAAAILCDRAGIGAAVLANQATYIQLKLSRLKSGRKMLRSAAEDANRAANWILGKSRGKV